MAAKILVIAWAAWLSLPLATSHLNVLISQAEVMKLLGKSRFDYKLFQYLGIIEFQTIDFCSE